MHDPLRPVAVVLRVAREHLLGGAPADLPGVAGRHRARIDGVEVAPGRQHVEPAARRRAGRPGGDEAPAERAQQAERFGRAAGGDALGAASRAPSCVELEPRGEAVRALGRAAEHMQAVADAHVLEVAEPGVERDQRLLRRLALGGAFLEQPARRAPARGSARRWRARGADRAPAPRRIRRTAPRARAPRHASRRRSAAASDGRSSPRRCGAWPAPPRRDC